MMMCTIIQETALNHSVADFVGFVVELIVAESAAAAVVASFSRVFVVQVPFEAATVGSVGTCSVL